MPAFLSAKRNDRIATRASKVLCFNERDSNRLFKLYGRHADLCLPISFEDCFSKEKVCISSGKELLFLGSCFGPNKDGVEWFIENVLPELEGYKLVVVGKGFESMKDHFTDKNVIVVGTVDDPSEYYYKYRAVVMPIRYGAGMKVKTAEAMMYGCHIFASDEALEGYDVDSIEGIDRCNTVSDYVNAILNYFETNQKGIQEDVRALFMEKYETKSVYEKYTVFMRSFFDELG